EIVPAFKGISEKLVPNAVPALDCPIMFNFAPNAVLIGFAASFIGGILALLVLIGMNAAGLAAAMILPGAVVHFFCGATAGVCGNATGGLKGAVVGAFVHGIVVTFLAAGLYPIMGALGFVGTTFSDADFTVVGIIFGTLCRIIGQGGLIAVAAILFALPIVYNYTLGRNKA
ncbi:MAG: PTS ascorbate transporter subunit IIC, partial [Lachnospiraceae bacterium]|nr:PTS ascorbate transporter subunit IIC [Lachnospiraceae bacterium]